jgi:hypothetical protein
MGKQSSRACLHLRTTPKFPWWYFIFEDDYKKLFPVVTSCLLKSAALPRPPSTLCASMLWTLACGCIWLEQPCWCYTTHFTWTDLPDGSDPETWFAPCEPSFNWVVSQSKSSEEQFQIRMRIFAVVRIRMFAKVRTSLSHRLVFFDWLGSEKESI